VLIIVELLSLATLLVITAGRRNLIGLPGGGLLADTVPNAVNELLVIHTLENTVTTDYEEVEVVLKLKGDDLWFTNNHIWVTAVTLSLGLNVPKSS